jgi:hypothetical protein
MGMLILVDSWHHPFHTSGFPEISMGMKSGRFNLHPSLPFFIPLQDLVSIGMKIEAKHHSHFPFIRMLEILHGYQNQLVCGHRVQISEICFA